MYGATTCPDPPPAMIGVSLQSLPSMAIFRPLELSSGSVESWFCSSTAALPASSRASWLWATLVTLLFRLPVLPWSKMPMVNMAVRMRSTLSSRVASVTCPPCTCCRRTAARTKPHELHDEHARARATPSTRRHRTYRLLQFVAEVCAGRHLLVQASVSRLHGAETGSRTHTWQWRGWLGCDTRTAAATPPNACACLPVRGAPVAHDPALEPKLVLQVPQSACSPPRTPPLR